MLEIRSNKIKSHYYVYAYFLADIVKPMIFFLLYYLIHILFCVKHVTVLKR